MLKMSQTKDEFLQDFVDGMHDVQRTVDIDGNFNRRINAMTLSRDLVNDAGYMMGALVGQTVDKQISNVETSKFNEYIMAHHDEYSDKQYDHFLIDGASGCRNDASVRILQEQDYDIISRVGRNYMYQNVANALTQIDDFDQLRDGEQLNAIQSQFSDSKVQKMWQYDVKAYGYDMAANIDVNSSQSHLAAAASSVDYVSKTSNALTPIYQMVTDFGTPGNRNLDNVLSNQWLSVEDKDMIKHNHQNEHVESNNIEVEHHNQIESKRSPVTKSKKHIKKRKSKSNDGPEM